MDALIFAAGRGTRLGELGRTTPKALIEVGGETMLARAVRAVARAGADRVVVNVHHQADLIERYLHEHDLGVEIHLSHEPERPLETGGGLWHARHRFRTGATILLHNVDVIAETDLRDLVTAHEARGAIATLAVNERDTARVLWFDESGLFAREDRRTGARIEARAGRGATRVWAFTGIHVIAPELIEGITERGVFSIVDVYLRLAAEGRQVAAWPLPGGWFEIGSAERLEAARAALGRATGG